MIQEIKKIAWVVFINVCLVRAAHRAVLVKAISD